MDSNSNNLREGRAGSSAGAHGRSVSPSTSLGYLAPSERVGGTGRSLSPNTLARTPTAITPGTEADGTEYFPPLPAPSLRSHPSAQGSLRPVSSGNPPSVSERSHRLPRQPSIRIRRRSSASSSRHPPSQAPGGGRVRGSSSTHDFQNTGESSAAAGGSGRQRSISQPERTHASLEAANIARHSRKVPQIAMPRLTEEGARPTMEELGLGAEGGEPLSPSRSLPEPRYSLNHPRTNPEIGTERPWLAKSRKISRMFWPGQSRRGADQLPMHEPGPSRSQPQQPNPVDEEYDARLVDWLDTIDPEVQTLSTLTNLQNSLFVPSLGKLVNRRPTYNLSQHEVEQFPPLPSQHPPQHPPPAAPSLAEIPEQRKEERDDTRRDEDAPPLQRSSTITSRLTESHYAALPHGVTLEGWSADDKEELDDHVRHMLHSRRSKLKRSLKGFGQYVRRPLGFFVTLYATLITLFGLAWVLFLIGWIYVGDKQLYIVHIIDSVLVALFAIMGDGLAPFRAVDTYHMAFVVHYARLVKKGGKRPRSRLQKHNIPPEVRESMDLAAMESRQSRRSERSERSPDGWNQEPRDADAHSEHSNEGYTMRNNIVDVEDAKSGIDAYEDTPLTYKQQERLHHHQEKLAKSHSFYKPHETETHYAFPLKYLIAVVILLDCHSCLQISLGACTWGIDYRTRPMAITTVILCVSIACNISAGLVITIGDRKTRKKDVWNLMTRQELTGDAMKVIEEKRNKDSKETSQQNLMSKTSSMSKNKETDDDSGKNGFSEKDAQKEESPRTSSTLVKRSSEKGRGSPNKLVKSPSP